MKRILVILTFVLLIGLLPAVALAEGIDNTVSLRILSWIDITAEEGGAIGYLKNQSYQGLTPVYEDGEIVRVEEKYTGWTQVPGTADDWNVKLEWPIGGVPTLTFKDAKLDHIGDDGVNFCDLKTDYYESWYQSKGSISAVLTKSGVANRVDLKIVFQGDNHIDVNNGIVRGSVTQTQYLKNITIVGEGEHKVYASGRGIGISPKAGYTLTLENLNLEMPVTTSGGGTPVPIRTEKADLMIKNCNITTGNEKNVAIAAMTSGNVLIENSTINVYSKLSSTAGPGCIYAENGNVTINNSKITGEGANNSVISGNNITLNNCELNLKSGYYSIYVRSKDGSQSDITVNGGSLLSVAGSGAFWKAPILNGLEGLCGKSEEDADVYDETKYRAKWLKLTSNGTIVPPVTQPTEAPTVAPSEAPTVAPTVAPSVAPTTAPSGGTGNYVTLRILTWIDITAEEGGAPGYLKNQSYQGLTPIWNNDGVDIIAAEEKYMGWTQVKGSADDWNVKLEWPIGGVPTLTFKDAKLDHIGDDGVAFCVLNTDKETGESWYERRGSISAVMTKSGLANRVDLKIVFQGDNYIDVSNGIVRGSVTQTQYLKNITIVGEGEHKVYASGRGIGISPKAGYTLTLENLNLTMPNTTVGGGTPIPLRTEKADLIIKNCTITTGNEMNVAIAAISSGNVLIENSTINVYSKLIATSNTAAIDASGGNVTITNSKITAEGANNSCINGQNVTITNSDLNLKSGYYSIYAGGSDGTAGDITINGGSLLSEAKKGAFCEAPILSAELTGLCGNSEEDADVYDETKYRAKWLKLYVANVEVDYNRSATIIKTSGANIWSKPYTTGDSKLVRTASFNTKVNVVAKFMNTSGSLWYKLDDGSWVYSGNVRVTDYNPADVETVNKVFVVTSWGANIWSKPYSSGDSKIVKSVAKAAELHIIAQVRNSTGGLWYRLIDGGWVYSHNVTERLYDPANVIAYKRSATITVPAGANIWSQPATSAPSKVARVAAYQTKVNVVAKYTTPAGGLWYQLSDGNWVYSTNVRVTDYDPASVQQVSKTVTVTSWGANIWSKPYSSGDSKVVKTVAKAANLKIDGQVRNSTYGLWYHLADGSGWIYSTNVAVK